MNITKFDIVLLASIILYFLENMYFGWNATPSGVPEKIVDGIVLVGLFYGSIGAFLHTIGNAIRPNVNITLNDKRPLIIEQSEENEGICHCGLPWNHTGKHRVIGVKK